VVRYTPAATADAVWLTSYPPAADPDTAARTAQEASLPGRPAYKALEPG
jgi:hypothetical protein